MQVEFLMGRVQAEIEPIVVKSAVSALQDFFKPLTLNGLPSTPCKITLATGVRVRMGHHSHKVKFVREANGQLVFKVQPGDNSTAWEWWLTPPQAVLSHLVLALSLVNAKADPVDSSPAVQTRAGKEKRYAFDQPARPHASEPIFPPPHVVASPPVSLPLSGVTAEAAAALPPSMLDKLKSLEEQADVWRKTSKQLADKLSEQSLLQTELIAVTAEITQLQKTLDTCPDGAEAVSKLLRIKELIM